MKRFFSTFFIVFSLNFCFAQQKNEIHNLLLETNFKLPENGVQKNRSFIKKKKSVIHSVAGALIYFYQNILSEQIQANCTYEISCSEYLKLCIEKYGFIYGTFAGINQYTKCSGGNHKNHSEFMIDDNNKIINNINDEHFKN